MENSIKLLLIEPASSGHRHAEWLRERNLDVVVMSDPHSAISQHSNQNFALILLEEALIDEMSSISLALQTPDVAVLAYPGSYSKPGYRLVMEKGAIGYINGQQEDQAGFVREVEKTLRKIGKLSRYGRLLIIDNDPDVLDALQRNLRQEGYDVQTASNDKEAWQKLLQHMPHIVFVDVRLIDNNDYLDLSGFDLMTDIHDHFGHAVRIICLTAYRNNPSAAPKAVGRFDAFVYKGEHPEINTELTEKIEEVLEKLDINYSLSIEFEGNLSFADLVNDIKSYRHFEKGKKASIILELEELIRKLFRGSLRIKAYSISPGRGGSGVVLVRPIHEDTAGEFFVLKFGPRESIQLELQKYNQFVKPFNRNWSTQIVDISDKPVETFNLGGLKFTFSGLSREKPRNFNDFYRDVSTKPADIRQTLQNLYLQTCNKWYGDKRPWSQSEPVDSLASAYESQLSLDLPDKQKELTDAIDELLNGKTFQGILFSRVDSNTICAEFADTSLLLPNPFQYVQANRHHFPMPKFRCRTHGDLNGRNMFVDEEYKVWLIDFFRTGWGPVLRDFGELETVIKFELLAEQDLAKLFAFERYLIQASSLREEFYPMPPFHSPEFGKACSSLSFLRHLASNHYESDQTKEHEIGLLFYALKMITWDGVSTVDIVRADVRRRHALFSAALLCQKLQNGQTRAI
jgi:CheY-like chemotaxis protein